MLTSEILNALKGHAKDMQRSVVIVLQKGEHAKREELFEFLSSFSSVSENISLEERDTDGLLRSPLSFILEVDGKYNGIIFSGIPGGHEFNSLVLAVLLSAKTESRLDENLQSIIKKVDTKLNFEVYISLSCHNCPDVVQVLNQFAMLNPLISSEMIDGGLYPDLIEKNNIQGVPAVFLNGESFANGKVDTPVIIEKLIALYPQLAENKNEQQAPLQVQDVTVIGGGPAGVAAAIYAARKGLDVTMVADRVGGQVKDTLDIENLISIPLTTGPKLSQALQAHMDEYDITLKEHFQVESIEQGQEVKTLRMSSGEMIQSKTVIIASGAKWRELGVLGEKENIGNGVAYCPHCDGPFFKGRDVAVVGGGNSGIEAAIDLAGIVKSVTVFEFMPDLKADQILIDQLNKRENVTIISNAAIQEITSSDGKVTGVLYQDRETEELVNVALAGVFIQIGLLPNTDFLGDLVELTEHGEIVVNDRGCTSEPGIYACGDVTTVPYKQIVIAMGEGAKAALSAYDEILMSS